MKQVYITSYRASDCLHLLSDFGGDLLMSELLNIINNFALTSIEVLVYNSVKYIKKIKG